MKQSINSHDFVEAFRTMGRYDQFGYKALQILFNYLESCEEDTGEEIELDVISLCCDYSVDTIEDIANGYSIDLSECETDEDRMEAVMEYLTNETLVCGVTDDGQVVYCSAF